MEQGTLLQLNTIIHGDALTEIKKLPDECVQCVVTSPPIWNQEIKDLGPKDYLDLITGIIGESKRVLKKDGTLWLHMKYGNQNSMRMKPGDMAMMPWRVATALHEAGWYFRADVVWNKENLKTDVKKDRPSITHEYVFLLSKSRKYYYNSEEARDDGDMVKEFNWRSVWNHTTDPNPAADVSPLHHDIVERCIKAGCPTGGVVLDPFVGSGTVPLIAARMSRNFIGVEIDKKRFEVAKDRMGLFPHFGAYEAQEREVEFTEESLEPEKAEPVA
jgi:site-specific DNA-methyltransferase (adenine-specific)